MPLLVWWCWYKRERLDYWQLIKREKGGGGGDTQMESQNRFTELEGEDRVGRCAPLGDKGGRIG